jgi:hypothetical protein
MLPDMEDEMVVCKHDFIPVEFIDQPAGDGLVRNVTKIYCPKCDEMKKVIWERPLEEIE